MNTLGRVEQMHIRGSESLLKFEILNGIFAIVVLDQEIHILSCTVICETTNDFLFN
ncbi:hypothetical protein D3C86_2073070 [compost metagenome]